MGDVGAIWWGQGWFQGGSKLDLRLTSFGASVGAKRIDLRAGAAKGCGCGERPEKGQYPQRHLLLLLLLPLLGGWNNPATVVAHRLTARGVGTGAAAGYCGSAAGASSSVFLRLQRWLPLTFRCAATDCALSGEYPGLIWWVVP